MSSGKPEKIEEKKFVTKIESHGWDCIKLSTQGAYGRTGRNDRQVVASYGVVIFFEFKRIGEEAEKLQDYYHRRLQRMGHKSYVVFTCDEAYKTTLEAVQTAKFNSCTIDKTYYDKLDYSGGTTLDDCVRKGKRF